ncbi:MAG: hypothetical protein KGH74_02565 [Candidatus Micrarchaeota archaeon]|nr:hypothetical protein [Candidatus Micrarchaeota archaeon]
MFRTEQMQKVRIVAIEDKKSIVIAQLHRMGIIDLRKSSLELADDRPLPYSPNISEMLIRINGALQILPKKAVSKERHMKLEQIESEVRRLAAISRIYSLSDERRRLNEDDSFLEYAEHVAGIFSGMKIDFSRLKSDFLSYAAFEASGKSLNRFKRNASRIENAEVIERKLQKGRFLVFIAYDKKLKIDELVRGKDLQEIDLGAKYLDDVPERVLKNVGKRKADNAKRLDEISRELGSLSSKHYSRMANLREMLEIEQERAEVSSNFKRTERTFIMEGWIEKRKVEQLTKAVADASKGRAYVEEMESDELAPTHTNRPAFVKPFEYIMNFYSTQRSDEIDPTWILLLSFPIFYGMMISDVGYGIASFFFVSWIIRKTDPEGLMNNVARIWRMMSVFAILFGFLSDQYFGYSFNQYFFNYKLFDWLKDAPIIIAITILFGITQVIVGLVFGFINNWRRNHRKLAIAKLTSILAMLTGTVAVSGAFFGVFNSTITVATAAVAIVSVIATAALSGIEATETLNLITHPLSYARIMGFGLGSIIIAMLIDQAFTPSLSNGALLFVVYLAIFIALHFLNMVLGIFEGLVQGVRLNFVEFFSKFYIGNGIRFKPFSYKRVNTKESAKE